MCLISESFVIVAFVDVLCHGDLIEKLKLLYKMHVIPGERAGLISRSGDYELHRKEKKDVFELFVSLLHRITSVIFFFI